jgi:hypothetical protein
MGFSSIIKTPNGLSLIGMYSRDLNGFSSIIKTPNGLSLIGMYSRDLNGFFL